MMIPRMFNVVPPRSLNGVYGLKREKFLEHIYENTNKNAQDLKNQWIAILGPSPIIHMGGRGNNYDFYQPDTGLKIEFKNNVDKISNLVQFLDLYHSSHPFVDYSYIRFYWRFYLNPYLDLCSTRYIKPEYEEYLKGINSTNPKPGFFADLKADREYNKEKKHELSAQSIRHYLSVYGPTINCDAVLKKIQETQSDKLFVMHKNGTLYHEYMRIPQKIQFDGILNGNTLLLGPFKLNLRWKNTVGINTPAWKIQYLENNDVN